MEELERFISNARAAQKAVDQIILSAGRRPRSLNETCFLNRAAVKTFLLEQAKQTRTHKFSRVSAETLRNVNELVRQHLFAVVRRLPSKGKTI